MALEPYAEPGWPRPRGLFTPSQERWRPDRGQPRELPVPWVVSRAKDAAPAWTDFHDAVGAAHETRCCQVCGEHMPGTVVLLISDVTNVRDDGADELRQVLMTSGPGCHPRCAQLTLRFCPHFTDTLPAAGQPVAVRYDGDGPGYLTPPGGWDADGPFVYDNEIDPAGTPIDVDELRELVSDAPLGTTRCPAAAPAGRCPQSAAPA